MRFLDSNIFIYAFYKPSRNLSVRERQMKDTSKKIINDVLDGKEAVLSTVVHVSEVANILKHSLTTMEIGDVIEGIFALNNVEVAGVNKEDYLEATELGKELEMDPNDALALQVMRSNQLSEIYSY